MKLEWLKVLDVLSQCRSLSEAAKRLHKTQPALTMMVKKIEQSVGFAVVNREGYRFSLTEQGQAFCRRAQYVLRDMDELSEFSSELANGNEPKFRISYEQVCVGEELSILLRDCYHAFAHTEFEIDSGRRFTALEQVNSGKSDLGIGPWFDIFHATGDLESLPLGDIEVGVVASPELIQQTQISYRELQSYPCVAMFESDLHFESGRMPFLNQAAMMKLDDIFALRSMLLAGAGWALMCLDLCQQEIATGQLQVIHLSDREHAFRAQIRAFRRHSRHHGPVARHVWTKLQDIAHG
ncbi:LysR family transcriptional regulator [Pseudoalteromonas sp. Cnat2-41]|uniref:LysR family transcriptional regulator n=1 Tax=unclassified Pseudoalteromonas TaxID=194690 RepID=UPI001EF80297|nr:MULTISPECIES: LysR family transcriptional regulator [unclassified Pseudoalteromonas]MCF2860646.1 LysR family transcriptional regulator [Pseudoalteromonas sp. CNAT2-18]MCG7556515.1 LysR family transcriptional regulator [Pseudoalteromonas sp. CNAT2-18.1]